MRIERYGVYRVNLDPIVGDDIAKVRPAVVVSDDAMNEHLGTVVVCPITSRLHPRWPSRIQATVGGEACGGRGRPDPNRQPGASRQADGEGVRPGCGRGPSPHNGHVRGVVGQLGRGGVRVGRVILERAVEQRGRVG